MDDSAIGEPEIGDLSVAVKSDRQVPQNVADVTIKRGAPLMRHHRTSSSSSSSPQLHSSLKKYKMGERSSESRRRVSFPKDAQLIIGYLEPIDPWACGKYLLWQIF